ncbi:MAG: ribonuclease D [Proteobacteria bacterium]|jgi:ribonuclease D|nr:ribonuclease D [Pseudomonadota bacterium]
MTDFDSDEYLYIDTATALQDLCGKLQNADVIALDTEFVRDKTYYARLCLLQVATDELVACIDPLALENLDCLLDIFYDPGKLKLLHAARQDLEIFYDLYEKIPAPLFDTQIAAALLGFSDQAGYGTVVEEMLGVTLDKGSARTDWAQRPLSATQLAYAADDVRYLVRLYPLIMDKLTTLGRQDWLEEDFRNLTSPALYAKDAASAWRRVAGHKRLKPRQLAVVQQLATWREEQARERNKPRKWILSDDVLVSLARQAPTNMTQLAKLRGIPPAIVKQSGNTILDHINQALALPREKWPDVRQIVRLSPDQECLADTLMAYLRLLGQQSGISPASLATRRDIEKLVRGERDLGLLHGWRGHIAGEPLLAMLEGKTALVIQGGRVSAEPHD